MMDHHESQHRHPPTLSAWRLCLRARAVAGHPGADLRILNLTRQEEKRLVERLENLKDLADLEHMQQRMYQQLGIRLEITPSDNEVRSMRGITIVLAEHPGLCRKTRQNIPAAIRRAMEERPEIAYRLLDSQDLLRGT